MFKFDMSTIEWTHFQGSPRFDYHIDYAIAVLGAQPDIGVIDLLVKWAPNAYCHYHRHLAATTTLVLGGEQNLYETTNTGETIHKVRKAGDLHMEQAGPDGALIFFGFVSADGRLFETLDKDHNTLATATVQEWAAGNIDGGRRTSIG